MDENPEARMPAEWRILDVVVEDAAGKRFLVEGAGGARMQAVEPPEESQSSLAFRERLKWKAARAREVRHECLVPTLGYAEDAGKLFVVEPDTAGASLAELIGSEKRLEIDAVLEVGLHVARALDALHRRGVVHGWVRPEAVVVTDERALLRDAGVEHPKGETAGPAEFMSPEQVSDDRSLRAESDFFSLGSVLFAGIVGRSPFVGATRDEVAAAVRAGRTTFPRPEERVVPRNVAVLLAKLLAADVSKRPQTATELVADLEAVRAGRSIARVTAEPPAPPRREAPPKKRSKKRAIVVLAATVIVFAAIVLTLVLPRRGGGPSDVARGPGATTGAARVTGRTTGPAVTTSGPARTTPGGEEQAKTALEEAEKYAREHPTDFDEIIRRFRRAAEGYVGTEPALAAERKATEFALRKSGAQLSEFDEVQREADGLVKERRFAGAIGVYGRYEVRLGLGGVTVAPELREKIQRQTGFIRAKAAESYMRESGEASKAVAAERYGEAARIFEVVAERYGLDEQVRAAQKELAILRPLVEAQAKTAAARAAKELEAAYRETVAEVQKRVKAFDLEGAWAELEKVAVKLKGSALESNATRHLGQVKRLLGLKQRAIERVTKAEPKVSSEALGIRATASVIESADAAGITLRSAAGVEKRGWADLSDWEKYSIARSASDTDSGEDLTALGLLSLEQGNAARALEDLRRAQGFGAKVDDLVARAEQTTASPTEDEKPAKMLVEARALAGEKKWADALVLLIPLKEKHATTSYAVREKLDEVNALLERCAAGLARADLDRDVAAGVETALLAAGIEGWEKTGKGWTFKDGRAACENGEENDVELMKAAPEGPAYRLVVRCRVVSGNGLLVRIGSSGDDRYDFWLGVGEAGKTGLWQAVGGKVGRSVLMAVKAGDGEWVEVRAAVTPRQVRVECGGQSAMLPNVLKAGGKGSVGLVTRQKSKAEFEDFRVRVLREQ